MTREITPPIGTTVGPCARPGRCAMVLFCDENSKRRSRAARPEVEDGDAELAGLVGKVAGEPGKTTMPIGRASSMRSLRLKGAALPSRFQSGLKAICVTLRLSAQQAAMRSA